MHDNTPNRDAASMRRDIQTDFSACLLAKLPPLAAMAEQVESIHFGEEDVPEGLSEILHQLFVALVAQLKTQELTFFPAIREGGASGLEEARAMMPAEHQRHTASISEIRNLTGQLTPPQGSCRTWRTLYTDLAEFIADLEEYMRLKTEALSARVELQK